MSLFDSFIATMSGSSAVGTSQRLDWFGAGMQVGGSVVAGFDARQQAQFQADQLRANAGQAQAAAQRSAAETDRQTQLILSRALAVAAAGGGGASDPTVVNLIAQDAAEGAYRKSVALYQGDDRARVLRLQADAKDYEGDSALVNGGMAAAGQSVKAGASILRGSARDQSLFERLGGGWPTVDPSAG
jgi:hypothetical protein